VEGVLSWEHDPLARLVVTDDRAYEVLEVVLPAVEAGIITVFAPATRSVELIAADRPWKITTAQAMLCRDLADVPQVPLPEELVLRPVRRMASDPADGVSLLDAAAAAVRANPGIRNEPDGIADYLRSLPVEMRLLVAVDANGAVRATSGSGTFGTYASVLFVNTDSEWRRRGIGRAMTTAALHMARASGATRACLDASRAGARIYRSLGFEVVGTVTRFYRAASPRAAS
jgi:ribosomal protein S18 acetylase RimI-like enzyme